MDRPCNIISTVPMYLASYPGRGYEATMYLEVPIIYTLN